MTVVSAFFAFLIIEHRAENAFFENSRPALLKTLAEQCQVFLMSIAGVQCTLRQDGEQRRVCGHTHPSAPQQHR